jgi:MipA family protein
MKHFKYIVFVIALIALFVPFQVKAQQSPFEIENVPNVVGIGVGMAPDYEGSNNYKAVAAPFFKFNLGGERSLTLRATELSANLLDHPFLRFGPILNYRFGRDHNVEDRVVKHMAEIDGAVEGGGFFGLEFVDKANPRKRFITSIDFVGDLGNTYSGYLVSLSVRGWYPLSRAFDLNVGAVAQYADNNYMETYFGVNPIDAKVTGLRQFSAGSGIKDYRLTSALVMHLSPDWHVGAGVQYRRLLEDAADSPVVKDRGSADQFIGGLGLAYSW